MLFVSRPVVIATRTFAVIVSISESRCFSFQGNNNPDFTTANYFVSISESRCFSFQENGKPNCPRIAVSKLIVFQSRNRDAFRFKNASRVHDEAVNLAVSISESRCFSFQVITGRCDRCDVVGFQSRNRDAFRFKYRCQSHTPTHPVA